MRTCQGSQQPPWDVSSWCIIECSTHHNIALRRREVQPRGELRAPCGVHILHDVSNSFFTVDLAVELTFVPQANDIIVAATTDIFLATFIDRPDILTIEKLRDYRAAIRNALTLHFSVLQMLGVEDCATVTMQTAITIEV